MAGQNLEIRQGQSLVMTQRLQQSIKMLQLPAQELQAFVLMEVQANPLLTLAEPEGDHPNGEESEGGTREGSEEDRERDGKEGGEEHSLDMDDESWWGAEASSSESSSDYNYSEPSTGSGMSATEAIELRHSDEVSLKDYLRAQVGTLFDRASDKLIAEALIDLVDESGYLTEDPEPIQIQLGALPETVAYVIRRLQTGEPTGIFARSLKECLSLQLQEKGLLDEMMVLFLEHLDLVASGEMKKLQKLTGMDENDIKEALSQLRTLNPKPGAAFTNDHVETLIPDVLVRKGPERTWRVELNPDALPKVLLNRQYHSDLQLRMRRKEDKKFISEQFASANWLMKALDQRATNLLKVSNEIVIWQKDFFEFGIRYLKPMRLSDIAAEAGVHESTVSRIVANKTMATPRGLFDMKYFFSTAVGGEDGGDAHSSRIIMHEIGQLIAKEKDGDILSDDTIAKMLKDRGMDVARRTVVKYRQILDIPSSVERRRQKARQG